LATEYLEDRIKELQAEDSLESQDPTRLVERKAAEEVLLALKADRDKAVQLQEVSKKAIKKLNFIVRMLAWLDYT